VEINADLKLSKIEPVVEEFVGYVVTAGEVFLMGNGGSAANASHIANDLVAAGIKATSLCDNLALLTATANDRGYDRVFADQMAVRLQSQDLVIVLSGSGKSSNIIAAVDLANEIGAFTIGMLGFDGGVAKSIVKLPIIINSDLYRVIETAHLLIGHMVADRIKEMA
jgi:D-sedoheptulose 7-phosphate isomerase